MFNCKLKIINCKLHRKVLIISGPTATGKTELAVKIAAKLHGEIISADSRQVYKGMDIGVGKDHPQDIRLHLIDLIEPSSRFSVANFQTLAYEKIRSLHQQNILPIVVGCSGLYIDSIINQNYSNFGVSQNRPLRFILEKLPVSILKFLLKKIDPPTYHGLNSSDKSNPRRLVRKIELKFSKSKPNNTSQSTTKFDIFHVTLTAPNIFLFPRIDSRVHKRMEMGHLQELDGLLSKYKWTDPGMQVSCYRVFKDHYSQKISLEKAVDLWKFAEHKDARHQKTWFKKYQDAHVVDISNAKNLHSITKIIGQWYNEINP